VCSGEGPRPVKRGGKTPAFRKNALDKTPRGKDCRLRKDDTGEALVDQNGTRSQSVGAGRRRRGFTRLERAVRQLRGTILRGMRRAYGWVFL